MLKFVRPRLASQLAPALLAAMMGGACTTAPSAPQPNTVAPSTSPQHGDLAARPDAMDNFYLSTCPLCAALLGSRGEAVDLTHQARHVRFCSDGCANRFRADPSGTTSAIDSLLIADQRPYYPTSASLIDLEPLGGTPLEFIWGNRLFLARDDADRNAILRDPAAAIRTLDQLVVAQQRPTYGMPDKCPVQGDILPNEQRIDIVVANRMIRVCCGRCVRVVKARPYQYLAMVEYANREAAARRAEESTAP